MNFHREWIAHEILPNLWLGDHRAIIDPKFLKSRKITTIVNCTTSFEFPTSIRAKYQIRVPVIDDLSSRQQKILFKHMPETVKQIKKWLDQGEIILVHCHAGAQRSASIVAGFLMCYGDFDYRDAVLLIQSKRSCAFNPGTNFKSALVKYQNMLDSQGQYE